MSQNAFWKERFYSGYVSSGQAPQLCDAKPEIAFQGRAAYTKSVIATQIPKNKHATILDLGCGHGTFLYFLSQAGYENVRGVDASLQQVELAHQLGIENVNHMEMGDFLSQAEDCSADVVLLMDILEHLTRSNLFNILDEVFRILRPGGRCIAHVPNAGGLFGMAVRYGDITHEMSFTQRSLEQIFRTVGFNAVQCFEDRPIVHGFASLARYLIWTIATVPIRLLHAAETGTPSVVLSRNILIRCQK